MDFFKGILLKLKGYKIPRDYWDLRWKLNLDAEDWTSDLLEKEFNLIDGLMKKHACSSILDVGCGEAKLRNLSGYVGFDFSEIPLKKSGLKSYLVGDISDICLDIPDKSFDVVMTRFVLLHISFNRIGFAVNNICRIARKLIVLREPISNVSIQTAPHCFSHDLYKLFDKDSKYSNIEIVFLNEEKTYRNIRNRLEFLGDEPDEQKLRRVIKEAKK